MASLQSLFVVLFCLGFGIALLLISLLTPNPTPASLVLPQVDLTAQIKALTVALRLKKGATVLAESQSARAALLDRPPTMAQLESLLRLAMKDEHSPLSYEQRSTLMRTLDPDTSVLKDYETEYDTLRALCRDEH